MKHVRFLIRLLTVISAIFLTLPQSDASASGGDLRISLLTCGPGKDIYQLEGHAALRITKTETTNEKGEVVAPAYDAVVNWGVFDFSAPNFVYRFVTGATDYMALAYPFDMFMEEYRAEGRDVVEQVLDLTPQQARRIEAMVKENIREENRTYRYNYVLDNCATRPLALIETAIGAPLSFSDDTCSEKRNQPTFRSEMTFYHTHYPWYQFGIDMALGSKIDMPVTTRERTFAPIYLRDRLETATFTDAGNNRRPIVKESVVLNHGIPGGVVAPPTPWPFSPVGVAAVVLVITLAISIRDIERCRLTRWFDTLLYGTFFLSGCVIAFLIFVSEHYATSPNWLFLWLNPLCIIVAAGTWIKRCARVVYCYQICNFAALTVLLAGHGSFGQALNAAFPLLILCDMMRAATYIIVPLRSRHIRNK